MSAFDVTSINAAGVLAFESSGLLESLKTNMASSSADTANSAMEMIKKLCEGNNCYLRSISLNISIITYYYHQHHYYHHHYHINIHNILSLIIIICIGCDQWIEPYLVSALPAILDNLAAPKTATAASGIYMRY